MKEQGKANKILYIIVAVIIILGAIFYSTKKFNMEPIYSNREQIVLSNNTEFDAGKVEEIARSVLNRKVIIKKVERFGNSVQIISDTISEEEKTNIVNRVNEECDLNIQNDDTKITKVANTRIIDIVKPYILPAIASFAAILLYFLIMYHIIGVKKVLAKGICIPVIAELTYYSLILIARIPFGRAVNSIAIGLYIVAVLFVTICFQKEKEKLTYKKEND